MHVFCDSTIYNLCVSHLLLYNEKWMFNLTSNCGLFMFHFFVPVKALEIIRHFETGRTFIYSKLNLGFLLVILYSRLISSTKITGVTVYDFILFSDQLCCFCNIMPICSGTGMV